MPKILEDYMKDCKLAVLTEKLGNFDSRQAYKTLGQMKE
jgi:hypothetical protein